MLGFTLSAFGIPRKLSDLVPAFLDELPTDPLSGASYVYRVASDGSDFELYSVGADQVDSGGKRSDMMRDAGDWVIWPPRVIPVDSSD